MRPCAGEPRLVVRLAGGWAVVSSGGSAICVSWPGSKQEVQRGQTGNRLDEHHTVMLQALCSCMRWPQADRRRSRAPICFGRGAGQTEDSRTSRTRSSAVTTRQHAASSSRQPCAVEFRWLPASREEWLAARRLGRTAAGGAGRCALLCWGPGVRERAETPSDARSGTLRLIQGEWLLAQCLPARPAVAHLLRGVARRTGGATSRNRPQEWWAGR